MAHDLRALARALNGEVVGAGVLCPGPGHSRKDRSLMATPSAMAADGFMVFSHAGDDWKECRDHVAQALGIERDQRILQRRPIEARPQPQHDNIEDRTTDALVLWYTSVDPRGTLAERYLASRGLELDDIAKRVIRWHAETKAMIALFRNIQSDETQAISRTFIDHAGRKISRKFLGPVAGGAIKFDGNDAVTAGLHIGEGIETCLAARQLGLRPTWAMGSCGAIAAFPVLPGIESLTVLAENDEASAKSVTACATRWAEKGREVLINRATSGNDLNDAIRSAAR
jgi:putative DNA primase/helicase